MTIKEFRIVSPDKVRAACIEHDWYTRGTNEEYSKMLTTCRILQKYNGSGFLQGLYDIACDIYTHSDINLGLYGCTKDAYIANIMYTLTNDCTTFSYDIDNY